MCQQITLRAVSCLFQSPCIIWATISILSLKSLVDMATYNIIILFIHEWWMMNLMSFIYSLQLQFLVFGGQSLNHSSSCLYSPEHHGAVLPVKGKIVDSDGTSAAVNGRRQPVHTAVRRHQRIAVKCYLELSIHTVHRWKQRETEIYLCISVY